MHQDSGPLVRASIPMIQAIRPFNVCKHLFPLCFLLFISEKFISEFPYWEDCHCMWHSNPSYSAKGYNLADAAGHNKNFMTIIKCGRLTASPLDSSRQIQSSDQDGAVAEEGPGFKGPEGKHLIVWILLTPLIPLFTQTFQ